MRIRYVLSLLIGLILAVLFAGCSGGGGGGNVGELGVLDVDGSVPPQWAVYTPPANREVYSVYAYFDNVNSSQIVTSTLDYEYPSQQYLNGCWQADLSDSSDQFSGTAIGDYDMSVYVIFADNVNTPVHVGLKYRVELNVIGNGPPPPPWP